MVIKDLLPTNEAATYCCVSKKFLATKRCHGDGPEFIKISKRCIRYRKEDLDKWLESKKYKSTSEY